MAKNKQKTRKTTAAGKERAALPKTSPKELAARLVKKGINVSAAYARTLKSYCQRKIKSRKPHGAPLEDLREAAGLMTMAVALVVKAGAKEAAYLTSMATQMVKKVKDEK